MSTWRWERINAVMNCVIIAILVGIAVEMKVLSGAPWTRELFERIERIEKRLDHHIANAQDDHDNQIPQTAGGETGL